MEEKAMDMMATMSLLILEAWFFYLMCCSWSYSLCHKLWLTFWIRDVQAVAYCLYMAH